MMSTRRFLLVLGALGVAACMQPKPRVAPTVIQPVTVSREMAYAHSANVVKEAYRAALAKRGLTADMDASGALTAVTPPLRSPGLVRIVVGPSDTLATRVSITYRYDTADDAFFHYPFRLPGLAAPQLDSTLATASLNQGTYPASLRSCPAPPRDRSARVEDPRLAEGVSAVASRVEYTDAAREAEVQGIVYLSAVVNEEGRVTCIEVLSGLPHGLTESAVAALRRATFVPGRQHGRAIAVQVVQPVWFKLID